MTFDLLTPKPIGIIFGSWLSMIPRKVNQKNQNQSSLSEVKKLDNRNNMAPSYMTDILSVSKNDHYSLRSVKHNDLVLTKKPKTQCFKNSFSYYSISIWNEIPCNIRNSPSINSLKSLYRNYLFNNS